MNRSQQALQSALGQNLRHFTDILVQDGSSFAVHESLAEIFGGRTGQDQSDSGDISLDAEIRMGLRCRRSVSQ